MNIALVTLVVGERYEHAVELATKSKNDYCRMYGYDLVVGHSHVPERPIAWSKIPLLQRVLPGYDYVFWSDADTLIVNYNTRLEDLFGSFMESGKHMVVTQDHDDYANTGNFLLKNSEWSMDLLKNMWGQDEFINDPLWEQEAFRHLLETRQEVREHSALLPLEEYPFVSYPTHPNVSRNHEKFLVHLSCVRDLGELAMLMSQHYKQPPVMALK